MSKIDKIRDFAREHIEKCYEQAADPFERRPYHGWWHTHDVYDRFCVLKQAVRSVDEKAISEEEGEAGEGASVMHDFDQTYVKVLNSEGLLMRKRFSGPIEGTSAMRMVDIMDKIGGFTTDQKAVGVEAIMATVPDWDGKKNRLIQPNLKPGVRLTSVLLAIADLGGGVMGGAAFAKEGRLVFTEDHLYVLDALLTCNSSSPPKNAPFLAERIVTYMRGQVAFLDGFIDRLFEEIIPLVPVCFREAILSVCDKGHAARREVQKLSKWAAEMQEKEDYMNLFRFMGYQV